jgi:hypothetical protein
MRGARYGTLVSITRLQAGKLVGHVLLDAGFQTQLRLPYILPAEVQRHA